MNKKISEGKRERFEKLATYRTNLVLSRLKVLGNCSNRSAYEYNEEEVEKIFEAIAKKVIEVKGRFVTPTTKKFEL